MAHAAARRPVTGALMNASRRTLASKAAAGASSTALPVVIHGKRTIKAGMVEEFQRHYDAYSKAMFERPGIKAVYAFADKNDPLSYWHVTFASDTASFDAARALVAQSDAAVQLTSTYTAPNDDDTLVLPPHVTAIRDAETVPGASRLLDKTPVLAMAQRTRRYVPDTLNVYGSWSDLAAFNIDQSVRHVVRSRLAGYIKSEGAAQPGPPLLGFTRRHVKPGRMGQLAASFQAGCLPAPNPNPNPDPNASPSPNPNPNPDPNPDPDPDPVPNQAVCDLWHQKVSSCAWP